MPAAVNYIVYAIPVFFLLIGIELLIDKSKKTGYYRLNDALSNINAGITEQVSGAFLKAFVVGVYAWIFDHYKVTTIPPTLLNWTILFIGIDFFYYWFHRLAHEINVLWGGHVVHHQSEEYNLSVALRQGAFQKFGSFLFYLPLAIIGFDPVMFIIISQFQTLYQFWIHTKTIHLLPKPIEYIFNTPSHHRVHHGRNPKYIDKNHGGTLIIWDRMFGTFQKEEEEVVYGITKPLKTWNPLRAQLDFWKDLFADLSKTKKLTDKLKLLFFPPGWFPQELGGPQSAPEITPDIAVKYNTVIPVKLNYYVLVQFVIILGLASLFLFTYESYDLTTGLIFMALILFSITSIGMILEANRKAYLIEIGRLLFTVVFYVLMVQQNILHDPNYFGLIGLIVFALGSILVFISMRKTFAK
ncbi:MAG TPA: sterol desaturase family protein [Chitinophagales bacterium]|nr:sterol desaturase family protein [Chitinophagales bacterium]